MGWELSQGDTFAGFHIWRRLGQGGMGTVYAARHPRLPRDVALKLLVADPHDAAAAARFDREAETIARLDHPGIVSVLDRGVDHGIAWISMQLVDGRDVASELRERGPLPVEECLSYSRQVAQALDVAHRQGVVHRDVKPANIMLTGADPDQNRRALLTDFGIAGLTGAQGRSDITGRLDGMRATVAFASPEQLRGGVVDGQSDQYSLACTLYTMLTGAQPYAGTSGIQVGYGHLNAPVPSIRAERSDVPSGVAAAIERAMSKDPADRFASCAEFADALQPPVSRRGRLLTVGLAALLAVAVAVGALAWRSRSDVAPAAGPASTVTQTPKSTAEVEQALWSRAKPGLALWPRLLPQGPKQKGHQGMVCDPTTERSAQMTVVPKYTLRCAASEKGYDKPTVKLSVFAFRPGDEKKAMDSFDAPQWVPRFPSRYLIRMYHFEAPKDGDWILLTFPGGKRSDYHMQVGSTDGEMSYQQLYDWVIDAPF